MLLLGLGSLVGGCVPSPPGGGGGSAEGSVAPDFRLPSLGGGELSLSDYEDKVVLLDFWATWCVPCHAQAEVLKPLYAEYRDRGFEVLSIDVEEAPEEVEAFVKNNPFPYPVLLDEEGSVSGQFAVFGLPTLVLIDREGKIAVAHTGVLDEGELREMIEAALG